MTARKAGGDQHDYLKYTLSDLLISHYQVMGNSSRDIIPVEQIHLNYSKIETEYREQKNDGTLAAAHKTGWDLRTHAAV